MAGFEVYLNGRFWVSPEATDFPELVPGQEQTLFELAKRIREPVKAQLGPRLAEG